MVPRMPHLLDEIDRNILKALQIDAAQSMDELSEKVNLSRNACWRRMRQMEEAGVIKGRVALVDPEAIGLDLSVLVLIKAGSHSPDTTRAVGGTRPVPIAVFAANH